MPSTSISTPQSTPSVDRLSLGVATARESAHASSYPTFYLCAASSED